MDTELTQISAPFTEQQVDALNQYQVGVNRAFPGHPFTCPNKSDGVTYRDGDRDHSSATHGQYNQYFGLLVATKGGWVCPHCAYTQDWAHAFMADALDLEQSMIDKLGVALTARGVNLTSILIERVDAAITAFSDLRMSRHLSVIQSEAENDKTYRILSVCAVMLASLRRRRMNLHGVMIRPSDPPEILDIDSTWIELALTKPADGNAVLVLVQDHPTLVTHTRPQFGGISNPSHDGYGCNAWIETRQFVQGRILCCDGYATHWRAIATPEATSESAPLTKPRAVLPVFAALSDIFPIETEESRQAHAQMVMDDAAGMQAGLAGLPVPDGSNAAWLRGWSKGSTHLKVQNGSALGLVRQSTLCTTCHSESWLHRAGCRCGGTISWGYTISVQETRPEATEKVVSVFMTLDQIKATGLPIVDFFSGEPIAIPE